MITFTRAAEHRFTRFQAEQQQRLVREAERAGVRIVLIERTGQHVAIEPGTPYAYQVDHEGCDCHGFAIIGKCPHHALLMAEFGLLEDPEEIGWPDDVPNDIALMVAD